MSVGLVLEGGGMRGAYTSGVLEMMMRENLHFDYIAGVSAGALTAMSFISRQPRRNYDIFVKYVSDPRYLGVSHLRKEGSIFNFDFILGELTQDILPFDFDTFWHDEARFMIGTTDCVTGKPLYFDKESLLGDPKLTPLRASSSLPMVSPIVEFGGYKLLDGGIADPIPIERSIADGNEYNVVVLTRPADYVKKPLSNAYFFAKRYTEYPEFVEALLKRHEVYTRQQRLVEQLERDGKAVVIRPIAPMRVGRFERNPERLAALFDNAMIECNPKLPLIKKLMEKAGA